VVIFHLSASPQILDKNKEKEGKGRTEGKRELSLPLIPPTPPVKMPQCYILFRKSKIRLDSLSDK